MRFMLVLALFLVQSCRTNAPSAVLSDATNAIDTSSLRPLPDAAQKLWTAYVAEQQNGVTLQPNCIPIQLSPPVKTPDKGLVVLYHGFSGCPIQFTNIGKKLAAEGYHVLLPLLPGQGRVPLVLDRARKVIDDDQRGMPTTAAPYDELTRTMNAIAAAYPGYKVVGGLSGGGAQALATAIEGNNPQTKTNIWNRALLYVPFVKIPGIQGQLAGIVSVVAPGLYKGFGANCEAQQLSLVEPRNGMCDFTLAHIRTVVAYGAKYANRSNELTIPVQLAGVENDPTSDNEGPINIFKNLGSADKHLCFFQSGVTHHVFYEGDYLHPVERPWVPEAEAAAIAWITDGKAFETDGPSIEPPRTTQAAKIPKCKILAPIPKPS